MRLEVEKMAAFYASPLGRMAVERMAARIGTLWPDADGLDVLGFGYAGPLLAPFRGGARRVLSAMPETQGALPWPEDAANGSVHVEDERGEAHAARATSRRTSAPRSAKSEKAAVWGSASTSVFR